MSRFGALLLLAMLTSPSWSQTEESKPDSSADVPTLPDEQPIDLPAAVKPPDPVTEEPEGETVLATTSSTEDTPTLPNEQPIELPEPVKPPGAVTFDPEDETVPEISTPPEIVYMTGSANHGEIDTTRTCVPKISNTPEPSTLVLASLGVTLMAARAYRRRNQKAAE